MDPNTPPESPVLEGSDPSKESKNLEDVSQSELAPAGQFKPQQDAVTNLPPLDPSSKDTKPEESRIILRSQQHLALPQSILYSNTLSRIIRLLQSANGLDKLIRTIQYTTRLLSHIMLVKDLHTPSTSTATKAIRRQFGLTRRLLRSFNNIGQINNTFKILLESPSRIKNDAIGFIFDLIEGLGYTGFGIADSLGYLPEAGIMTIPYKSTIDKMAFHFWLYALTASIIGGLLKVHRLRRRIGKYKSIFPSTLTITEGGNQEAKTETVGNVSKEVQSMRQLPPTPPESPIPTTQVSVSDAAMLAVKDLEMQRYNISLNVTGHSADILFPLAALKVHGFDTLSDGILGFAGCISSAVGFRKAWKATA
ncbi:hypothetical protein ABW19_dt0201627 [Dactylella cylindrospora]|nr:hypothetical protein ABW19_dt0201627 [Dactylella cylindrospora]